MGRIETYAETPKAEDLRRFQFGISDKWTVSTEQIFFDRNWGIEMMGKNPTQKVSRAQTPNCKIAFLATLGDRNLLVNPEVFVNKI